MTAAAHCGPRKHYTVRSLHPVHSVMAVVMLRQYVTVRWRKWSERSGRQAGRPAGRQAGKQARDVAKANSHIRRRFQHVGVAIAVADCGVLQDDA